MRQKDAEEKAKKQSQNLLIAAGPTPEGGWAEAWCEIKVRCHRTLSSFGRNNTKRQGRGAGNYTVSRAPKTYRLELDGAVVSRPDSYEAAMAKHAKMTEQVAV